jgi:predicted O-methyltransferase YrrM
MPTSLTTFDETFAAVADVEGWMTPAQARRLWDASGRVPAGGTIVEIGSFRGRSTIVLARAADDGVTVVAIDPHAGNDRGPQEIEGFVDEAEQDNATFEANLTAAGVRDRVRHLRMFSDAAHDDVEGDIELLYVDGAHRYRPALTDIQDWGRRITPGGTLLIHDSFSSIGVTGAIARALFFTGDFRYVGRSESMTEYRHEPVAGTKRATNAGRQIAQLPWFARNVAIKVLITAKLGKYTRLLGHPDPSVWPY